MIFLETTIHGVVLIGLDRKTDERGFFARSWCESEFAEHGLNARLAQCNISYNDKKGTLRGIHYQEQPNQEAKLVRCTKGAIYDVAVDLRPMSPSFKRYYGVRLDDDNRHMLYVPEGCGHGFLTLSDHVEVFYQMSEFYHPESARGVRWNDPAFQIDWPEPVRVISERDRTYPDFMPAQCTF
ncbi:MAG TPA: dTDP-4-dehydrorhamnose 3,5-epimerase [Terriglobales bacterium]|nr:dTDP-4-dehydrorhamnose 3,5-epimerase [Terriglobales bacterium]